MFELIELINWMNNLAFNMYIHFQKHLGSCKCSLLQETLTELHFA